MSRRLGLSPYGERELKSLPDVLIDLLRRLSPYGERELKFSEQVAKRLPKHVSPRMGRGN